MIFLIFMDMEKQSISVGKSKWWRGAWYIVKFTRWYKWPCRVLSSNSCGASTTPGQLLGNPPLYCTSTKIPFSIKKNYSNFMIYKNGFGFLPILTETEQGIENVLFFIWTIRLISNSSNLIIYFSINFFKWPIFKKSL